MSQILGIKFKVKYSFLGFSNKQIKLEGVKNYKKILIFFSGPLCNFIISMVFLKISFVWQLEVIFTNIFLAILNLLPIIPLDGGNILICILRRKLPIIKTLKISLLVSRIFLIVLSFIYCTFILVIKNIWILVLILYLWYIFINEERKFEFYFKIQDKAKELII